MIVIVLSVPLLHTTLSLFPGSCHLLQRNSHMKHLEFFDATAGKQINCWGGSTFVFSAQLNRSNVNSCERSGILWNMHVEVERGGYSRKISSLIKEMFFSFRFDSAHRIKTPSYDRLCNVQRVYTILSSLPFVRSSHLSFLTSPVSLNSN